MVRRGPHQVLRGIELALSAGEVVAVIGANGAGKSTLLNAIAGLLPLAAGAVEGGRVYLLPDEAQPCAELTVGEQLDFDVALTAARPERSSATLDRLGLRQLLKTRCGALSRGEARRVLLHAALVSDLPWLLLDEPLGTFDPLQLREVIAALREKAAQGAGVLVTCHQLSDAEKLADRLVVLHDGGVLAEGSLEQLRARVGAPGASLETVFVALLRSRLAAA